MVRYFIAIVRFYSTLTNLAVQVINVCNYREYSNELCIRNNIFVGRNPRGFDNGIINSRNHKGFDLRTDQPNNR